MRYARLLYRTHVWLGMSCGLVFFLLCLSGTLAMFKVEFGQWLNKPLPEATASCRLSPQVAFDQLRLHLPDGEIRRLSLPALTHGFYELRLSDGRRAAIDICGNLLSDNRARVGDFLVNLHTRLFMGKVGRWIIGGIAVLMLLSTITGLLAHRKLLTQAFTLRRGRSYRLWLSDAHKLLGVWLLPFHLLTSITGAWLGLYTLIYDGGAPKGVSAPAAISYSHPVNIDSLMSFAQVRMPGIEPVFLDFFPMRGHISLRGNLPGYVVQRYSAELLFDGQDSALLGSFDPRTITGLSWLAQAMMPLHFGDWLGGGLRLVYALLGFGTTALIWLGLKLWANRRESSRGFLWQRGMRANHLLFTSAIAMTAGCVVPLILHGFQFFGNTLGGDIFLIVFIVSGLTSALGFKLFTRT